MSGSIGRADLARGFSVVNRLFKYGIAGIDVIHFDTELNGGLITLRRARRSEPLGPAAFLKDLG